jgi:hypothetical protein
MSAGTVGFTDTRTDTNHIGSVISRILEARQLAEDERKYAEAQADKYQTSLEEAGIKRGDFFKKALRWKFGGEIKQKKLSQINTWKKKGGLLKTAATGKSGKNKLNRFERSQVLFDMFKASDKPKSFRDKFKPLYEGFVDDPLLRPMSHLVKPGTAKKIQKATTSKSKKRVSKEDILDSIAGITNAIEKIAESISEKNKIVSDQMIHSSVLQGMIHTQLKTNGDSLEEKLQKIVDAISNQTQYKKEAVDKAKSRDAENKLEEQKDVAGVASFDDVTTEKDESIERPTGGYPELSQMGHAGMDLSGVGGKTPPMYMPPQAEQGAILSGPDSGYLVELHGKEKVSVEDKNVKVEPINNRYTRGQSSAVDGKVRPKPTKPIATPKSMPSNSIPKLEMGTDNKSPISSSPITSKFGFNTARNQMGIAGGGTTQQSKMTQTMVDLMSLPMTASGATMLASTTAYMQSLGKEGADIKPEIERIARPIAKTFGLPASIVNKAKQGSAGKSSGTGKPDGEDGESNKNIFAKLMDGFGAMLDKMKDSINPTPPGDPGPPGKGSDSAGENLAAFISTLEATGEQNQADVMQVMINRAKGDSDKLFHEVTGKAQFTPASSAIYGATGHDPAADAKYGHIAPLLGNTPEERKAKLREIASGPEGLNNLDKLFKTKNAAQAAKVLNDFKTGGSLSTKSKADVGGGLYFKGYTPESGGVYLDRGAGANKFHTLNGSGGKGGTTYQLAQSVPTPPTTAPSQLGQGITNNYGLKVGQERTFTVPGYGEVKAHKTAIGFEFFKPGITEKLDLSKPQGKTIVDYFKSTNGGQTISPPANPQAQQISSLSSKNNSESGNIAMLNIGGGSQTPTAGSSPQPSGEDGTESGTNPTQNFYSNSFSIGVG